MASGYPFRTGILRRVLRGPEGIAGQATLRIPAIAGLVILLIAIPTINKTLLTETRLREDSSNILVMRTDCGTLDVNIALWPYDSYDVLDGNQPLIGAIDTNFDRLLEARADGSLDRDRRSTCRTRRPSAGCMSRCPGFPMIRQRPITPAVTLTLPSSITRVMHLCCRTIRLRG